MEEEGERVPLVSPTKDHKRTPWQRFVASTKYSLSDVLHTPRNFAVGLCTVFIVVCFVGVLQNAVVRSSEIFVRLSEEQTGEIDVLFVPEYPSISLNQTFMETSFRGISALAGTVPRWTIAATAVGPLGSDTCIVLVFDTIREQNLGLGRTWLRRPLASDETYVSSALLRRLGVVAGRGQKIMLQLDLAKFGNAAGLFGDAQLEIAIVSALNATITQLVATTVASLPANSSVNVAALFLGFGVAVPAQVVVNGETVDTSAVPVSLLQQLGQVFIAPAFAASLIPQVNQLLKPSVNLTVLEEVGGGDGKWPSALGNVLVLEQAGVPALIQRALPSNTGLLAAILQAAASGTAVLPTITTNGTTAGGVVSGLPLGTLGTILGVVANLENYNLDEYALLVCGVVKNRNSIYLEATSSISLYFRRLTNDMYDAIGYDYKAVPSTPLADGLEGVAFVKLFLDQIFGSVMAILIILGAMLIYALLLSNVGEKTYEYGMLRALGLERSSLIGLLVVSASFFTIPGVGLGLLGAWLLSVVLSLVFGIFTKAAVENYNLAWQAVVLAVVVGIVMPYIANLGPIRRALSRTLRDSLDIYHTLQAETTVKVIRGMAFSWWQTLVSICLVITGFIVYYLVPYAFIFEDFVLFLGILTAILLAMVLGLCLVATTVQPTVERLVVWAIVWGSDAAKLTSIISKNMSAHRGRNRKTALMFTLSLGFIIFAGASFTLQANTIQDSLQSFIGADCNVYATQWDRPLPTEALRALLLVEMERNDSKVTGFDFGTFPLDESPQVSWTGLGNMAQVPFRRVSVVALEQNHLQVVTQRFYVPNELASGLTFPKEAGANKADAIDSLYSNAHAMKLPLEEAASPAFVVPSSILSGGSNTMYANRSQAQVYENYVDIVCSEAMRLASSITTKQPLVLRLDLREADGDVFSVRYAAKAHALVSKLPGFFISSYSQTAIGSPVFVSVDNYMEWIQLINDVQAQSRTNTSQAYVNITQPPMQNVWVSFRADATVQDIDDLINRMKIIYSDDSVIALNVKGLVAATSTATSAMIIFFNVCAIINTVLSFFLLWLSFDANVRENSWEFGVLRCFIDAGALTRCYIYEAVAVVIGAVTLGTAVGILVSVILQLQYNLFLELPFVMLFPWPLWLVVFLLSLVVAFLGAWIPAQDYCRKEISSVIRGIN